jgi:hypothetical protein
MNQEKLKTRMIFSLIFMFSFLVNPLAQLVAGSKTIDWTQSIVIAVLLTGMAALFMRGKK